MDERLSTLTEALGDALPDRLQRLVPASTASITRESANGATGPTADLCCIAAHPLMRRNIVVTSGASEATTYGA